MFIERVSCATAHIFPADRAAFTGQKEFLKLLVAGRSPLGIGERRVKAPVAKLLRKVRKNHIALSVHGITLTDHRKIEVEHRHEMEAGSSSR